MPWVQTRSRPKERYSDHVNPPPLSFCCRYPFLVLPLLQLACTLRPLIPLLSPPIFPLPLPFLSSNCSVGGRPVHFFFFQHQGGKKKGTIYTHIKVYMGHVHVCPEYIKADGLPVSFPSPASLLSVTCHLPSSSLLQERPGASNRKVPYPYSIGRRVCFSDSISMLAGLRMWSCSSFLSAGRLCLISVRSVPSTTLLSNSLSNPNDNSPKDAYRNRPATSSDIVLLDTSTHEVA